MNLSLSIFLALAVVLIAAGIWRRSWLFAAWLCSILLAPTAQARVLGAPFYVYDLAAVILIASFAASGEMARWPRNIPRWHWWFIISSFVLSVGFGFVRYGFLPDILWIWGHSSLAWMPYAFGMVLVTSNANESYRKTLTNILPVISVLFCAMALVQFANLPGSERISSLYYEGLGSEQSVEILRLGEQSNRATGPHFAPTAFGGMALLLGMLYWLLTEWHQRWLRILVALTSVTTIVCTVSRHVMLALIMGLGVFIFACDLRRKAKLILACTVFGAILSTTALGWMAKQGWAERLARWDEGILNDENIAARLFYGPARLVNAIETEPSILITGAGLDPEKLISRHGQAGSSESGFVSNGFLLALYCMGIAGFFLYGFFWVWTWRLARRFPPGQRALLTSFVAMTIIIVAADNYSFMYEPAVAVLFLIASLVAGRRHLLWANDTVRQENPALTGMVPRPMRGGAYAS
jgi:O-antigen ligase